jgi:hypothetical protein
LLHSHNQDLTLHQLIEIRNQSALEKAEEPEPEPEERTMTVLKLTDGLGLTDAGIERSEGIDWN